MRCEVHLLAEDSVIEFITTSSSASSRAFLTLGSTASSSAVRFPSLVPKNEYAQPQEMQLYTLAPLLTACAATRQRRTLLCPASVDICACYLLLEARNRILRRMNVPSFEAELFCWWPMTPCETRCALPTRKRGDILFVCVKIIRVTVGRRKPFCQARAPDESRE